MAQSMRVATIAAAVGLLFALVAPTMAQQQQQTEQPLKPEKNPPGDIPDNQVFITYASPRGFSFNLELRFTRVIVYPDGHKHIDGVTPKQLPSPSSHRLPSDEPIALDANEIKDLGD
jgi:hypothetical protein